MDRVPDSIFDVLQGVADDVGTTFSGASELEKTIWFATSLEPSPPSQHDLRKICAATRDSYVNHLNPHWRQSHKLGKPSDATSQARAPGRLQNTCSPDAGYALAFHI